MKFRIVIDGTDTGVNISGIKITKQLSGNILSTASFNMSVDGSNPVLPVQQSEVIIYNDIIGDDTDAKVFRGYVVSIEKDQSSASFQIWKMTANGLEMLLDNVIVNGTWSSMTDRAIIQDAYSTFLPAISTDDSTVAELTIAFNFGAKDLTMTQFMANIVQVSGGEWRITEDLKLSYRAPGSVTGLFGFSDFPNTPSEGGII